MESLIITYLGEKKPLVVAYSNLDGTFRVESDDRDTKEYFSGLINKISQENPALPLMTGQTEMQGNIIIEKDIQKQVPNTDVEYLSALWDYFNRGKPEYKGRRFRAYTTEAPYFGKRDMVVITGSVEETIRKRQVKLQSKK